MTDKEISRICGEIFIKCIYSAHLSVGRTWRYNDEKTEYCNLVLVRRGQGIFTCGKNKCVVTPGDLVYFPQGSKRSMRTSGDKLVFRSINFKYTFNSDDKALELPFDFVRHIDDRTFMSRIEYLFSQIQKHYISLSGDSEFEMRYFATKLIYMLLTEKENGLSFSQRSMIDNSVKYMTEHLSERITLERLAEISGKSISYYGKEFKKALGISPIEYLLHIRTEYAKKMLENGVSVTETSRMCGFENLYYFSRVFKKRENISPSEYAKKRIRDIKQGL